VDAPDRRGTPLHRPGAEGYEDAVDSVDDDRLVLGDLLNHVLDKGVVLTGDVTISVADIDLIRVGLSVVISSVETMEQRGHAWGKVVEAPTGSARPVSDADLPILPPGNAG
jgi:hypothetical protein